MFAQKKIRVLIIDDSRLFREAMAMGISNDKGIEVIGTASDPFEARDKIIELEPDVLTLDIEMPKMNGIEFLKRLIPQYPIPVVVVSALNNNVFEALNSGAVDYVTKPDNRDGNRQLFFNELIVKIKIASLANLNNIKKDQNKEQIMRSSSSKLEEKIIAIGASTGGTEALFDIIHALPTDMPGIVIVQHMPPVFTRMYSERLNSSCRIEVKEAKHGDIVIPGRVLIAPGDYHMRVSKRGNKYFVECIEGERVNGHKPSVDVLFDSVAENVRNRAIGVILTGMGYDGAKGLLNMKQKGAITIGQDEKSCVVYGMPKVAYNIGAVQEQVPLTKIPRKLCEIINK